MPKAATTAEIFAAKAGERIYLADEVISDDLDYGGVKIFRNVSGTATDVYQMVGALICRKYVNCTGVPSWRWLLFPSKSTNAVAAADFFRKAAGSRVDAIGVEVPQD